MPYIPETERIPALTKPQTPGELAYTLTMLIDEYLDAPADGQKPDAAKLMSTVGVIESVKLEFYTRLVAAYENRKMAENGDVYSPDLLSFLENG